MGVKIMRLAIDTGRMDLVAHALVLAAVQSGLRTEDGDNLNEKGHRGYGKEEGPENGPAE